jgi:hypothetical protein
MTKKPKRGNTQRVAPVCRIEDTRLRIVSEIAGEYIPATELSAAITDLPKMDRRINMLQKLDDAFQNTIEAFRKLDLHFVWGDDGLKQICAPLRPVLQILGIVHLDADGEEGYESVRNFCAKFGIVEDDIVHMRDGSYGVPAGCVIGLIKAAQLPNAITARLVDWFTSFLNERTSAAPWISPWRKDVDFFH